MGWSETKKGSVAWWPKKKAKPKGPRPIIATSGDVTGRLLGVETFGLAGWWIAKAMQDPMDTYQHNNEQQRKIIDAESRRLYKKNFSRLSKKEQRRIFKYIKKEYK